MPKSNAQRGKEFRERKKKEKLAASPVGKVTPPQNSANSSSATAKSRSEYMREYQAQKKTLQNAEFNDKEKNSANSSSATAKSPSEYT
ncbi:hypothetical protein TNCV_4518081 [Trichonephila clavipes]|nr:hypothetical protein TNCV_4518081 [Trichonephila clavipes]